MRGRRVIYGPDGKIERIEDDVDFVPPPPPPTAADLLQELEKAVTVDDLKRVLTALLTRLNA